jgi:diguanylate cyclase (GGDEF)-like protein
MDNLGLDSLVLIVEDDVSIANLEKRYLEKEGFKVLIASTGEEGLRLVSTEEPHLLIIDYRLPDMSGVELMQKVKELGKKIPSVIVTGGGDETVAVTAMKLGALDYIVKDRDTIKHLPDTCKEVLKKFNLEEENLRLMEELKRVNKELTEINKKLDDLSKKDDLTGVFNRRYLMSALSYETAKAHRYNYSLSFAIFDLDHFKQINDTYGHTTGDVVLKQFAELLNNRLRKTDILGRYGGEEFGIIFTGTALDNAMTICNELRELVAQTSFGPEDIPLRITTSAGVAYLTNGMEKEKLIDVADKSLYKAKESGRNQVVALQKEGETS